MKFTITRKDFIDALYIGGAMSSKKNTIPILEYAKVKVDSRQMVVSSTDSEVYITKRVFLISCSEEREFCVSSSDLIKALKSINEEEVEIKMDDKNMQISHQYGKMKFPYISAGEFPTTIKAEEEVEVSTDCRRLYDLINKGKDFIDSKIGTAIGGIYLYADGNHGGVCGSDGHKLFSDTFPLESNNDRIGSIIPMSAVPYILNTIYGGDNVSIVFEGRNITFKVPNARINCRVIDLNYPPFEKVIPRDNDKQVEINLNTLKNSVNRAKMFTSNKGGTLLSVMISDDNMDIIARDYEENKEGSETISVEYNGEPVSVGLNGIVLSQCLSAIDGSTVTLKIKDGEHGLLFYDDKNPERIIMQMPIVQR